MESYPRVHGWQLFQTVGIEQDVSSTSASAGSLNGESHVSTLPSAESPCTFTPLASRKLRQASTFSIWRGAEDSGQLDQRQRDIRRRNVTTLDIQQVWMSQGSEGRGGWLEGVSMLLPIKHIIVRSPPDPLLNPGHPAACHTEWSVSPPTHPGGVGCPGMWQTNLQTSSLSVSNGHIRTDTHKHTRAKFEIKSKWETMRTWCAARPPRGLSQHNQPPALPANWYQVAQSRTEAAVIRGENFCIPCQRLTGGSISMVARCQRPSGGLLWQGQRSKPSVSVQCAKAMQRASAGSVRQAQMIHGL